MSEPYDHGDVRYLAAKRAVDDRTHDVRVRERLLAELPSDPVVYDAGAGTGAALGRLLSWGVSPDAYHGVDSDPALIDHAVEARAEECATRGLSVERRDDRAFRAGGMDVSFGVGDVASPDVPAAGLEPADLVVAASLLDLLDIETAMDRFGAVTATDGLVYAPATFDGATMFAPTHPADGAIERVFHDSMRAKPDHTPEAARTLVSSVTRRGGELLAVGSSDWVVCGDGGYPDDDRYFLDRICGYVASALLDREDGPLTTSEPADLRELPLTDRARSVVADSDQTAEDCRSWLCDRRRALEAGELTYLAHQLDVLYRPA